MARKHSYKNDLIPASYVDFRGVTVAYPNAGELRLGANAGFLNDAAGHQSINTDGTTTSQPAQDEKISQYIACECCGIIVTDKRKLIKNSKGRYVCNDCIRDDNDPRR